MLLSHLPENDLVRMRNAVTSSDVQDEIESNGGQYTIARSGAEWQRKCVETVDPNCSIIPVWA